MSKPEFFVPVDATRVPRKAHSVIVERSSGNVYYDLPAGDYGAKQNFGSTTRVLAGNLYRSDGYDGTTDLNLFDMNNLEGFEGTF